MRWPELFSRFQAKFQGSVKNPYLVNLISKKPIMSVNITVYHTLLKGCCMGFVAKDRKMCLI